MVTYGLINRRVARMLEERGVEVVVFEESEPRAEMAREDGFECVQALVTDPSAEDALRGTEAFVLMDMDPLRVDRLAKAFRRRFPGARVVAPDMAVQDLPHLRTFSGGGQALRVGQEALAEAVVSAVEDHMARRSTDHLLEVLRGGGEGGVAVFTHDDPDPDAIASGMGMLRICQQVGMEARLYHGGRLDRLENRFFARIVEAPLLRITTQDAELVVQGASRVVLVDAGRPGVHNVLPPGTVPNVVMDHHSTNREASTADYCDVRPGLGSTSTMVALHLQEMGVVPEPRLATAMLFGIRTDTDHLRRNAGPADMRASVYLASLADQALLDLLEGPPLPSQVMDVTARGIGSRRRVEDHVLSWCGEVGSRDDLAYVSDFLLKEEDVAAVFVFGRVGDRVHVSARSVTGGPHVGELVQEALGDIGSGGGHATMAGGSVDLLGGVDLDVDRWVEGDLFNAFLDASGLETP